MGGTAAVYRSTHSDGRACAVKVMHSHLAYDRGWVRRLKREAALLGSLNHPGLVRVLQVAALEPDTPFLVMELLEGRSLEALRRGRGGKLPVDEALRYTVAILDVLEHTHARGVIHRDLKPSNVFVTAESEVKVLDFGIAAEDAPESAEPTFASTTRGLLGTPAYMAPEQARGRWELVDQRSDLWAVAAIFFALVSGECVHVAGTENERLGLAMSRPARSIASLLPRLDPALVRVINRALAYDPAARFQTASEFRRALSGLGSAEALAGSSETAALDATVREVSEANRAGRSWRRPVLASLAALGLLLTSTWFLAGRKPAPAIEAQVPIPASKLTAASPSGISQPVLVVPEEVRPPPSEAPALAPGASPVNKGTKRKPAAVTHEARQAPPEVAHSAQHPAPAPARPSELLEARSASERAEHARDELMDRRE